MAATRTVQMDEAIERAAVQPFADQLHEVAREVDPEATYTLAPPIDAGIWIMHLHVRRDLADKANMRHALAERKADFLIEHGVGLATMFHEREAARPAGSGRERPNAAT